MALFKFGGPWAGAVSALAISNLASHGHLHKYMVYHGKQFILELYNY